MNAAYSSLHLTELPDWQIPLAANIRDRERSEDDIPFPWRSPLRSAGSAPIRDRNAGRSLRQYWLRSKPLSVEPVMRGHRFRGPGSSATLDKPRALPGALFATP